MQLHEIEDALRRGPPDEPNYEPGAFRRSGRRTWVIAGGVVAGGLLVGTLFGVGLGLVRAPITGASIEPEVIASQLEGSWISDEISFDAWVSALEARGFQASDIGEFLVHDSFEQRVQYGLIFRQGVVTIQARYDGAPMAIMNLGTYDIDGSGQLRYVETMDPPPRVGELCHVVARIHINGNRLKFDVLDYPGCGTDPRMAHTLFFDLLAYTRTSE
jgi:hypothetical protein